MDDNDTTLTAEDQATLDQMRADEAAEAPEQPAAPEAETPAEAPAAEEPAAPDERQKTVPHAALHEERERRKETERRLVEAEQRSRTLEERTNLILARFAQPQQEPNQPAPMPDREKDPVGYLEAQILEARREAAAVQQQLQQRTQQDQHAQVAAMIEQHMSAAEVQFRQTVPDYDMAITHLINARHRQLEAAGWTDPVRRQNQIRDEARGVAALAIQARRDPAERAYALAKEFGYAPPQPAAEPQSPATATEQRLDQIQRGQQQSRSLGSVRGGAPPALTATRLAEMSEEEFNQVYDTAAGRALRGA